MDNMVLLSILKFPGGVQAYYMYNKQPPPTKGVGG